MLQKHTVWASKTYIAKGVTSFMTHLHAPRKINLQQTTPEDIRFSLFGKIPKEMTVVHTPQGKQY